LPAVWRQYYFQSDAYLGNVGLMIKPSLIAGTKVAGTDRQPAAHNSGKACLDLTFHQPRTTLAH
jgi:hypothetical protein